MEKNKRKGKEKKKLIVHRARRWKKLKQAESLAAVPALLLSSLAPPL